MLRLMRHLGNLRLLGPASRLRLIPAGRIWMPLVLLCLSCVGGRTSLADAAAEASTSESNDPSSWDGGLLPSTPGRIRCGSTACGQEEQCCLREEGRPASNGCDSRARSTCRGSSYTRKCDESADCSADEHCCWRLALSPPSTIASFCISSRDAADPKRFRCDYFACGSNDDCRAVGAPSCVAQRCRDDILQSCGLMPSAVCTP
jgi:hypothetical protein